MFTKHDRAAARRRRHVRVRKRIRGTAARPRLCVHRSLNHITAQLIDDEAGHTLISASTTEAEVRGALKAKASSSTTDAATAVGKAVAQRAKRAGIAAVVFDRGGYLYHGRVKALAEAARSAGLEF